MKPFPYQVKGADFLAQRQHAFLADGMGLGKSRQAIMAADYVGATKILVLCPSVARTNWAAEFKRFSVHIRDVQVLVKTSDKPEADVLIASYDYASSANGKKSLNQWGSSDVLIVDEAHFIKNRDAKRTKAVYGYLSRGKNCLVEQAKRVWLLSGTPMPNNASELWTHLRALWPQKIDDMNLVGFIERYCKTYHTQFGHRIIGNKNVPNLKYILSDLMLRRTAEKVLPELPPITWDEFSLDDVDAKAVHDAEREEEVVHLRAAIATGETDLATAGMHLQSLRRLTGTVKAGPAAEWITNLLDDNKEQKLIVFAIHSDVIEILKDRLAKYGAVELTGKTSAEKRDKNIERFRNDADCRVFIGQIHACGTAINLQVASLVVFVEFDWTPANNLQAAKRAHRIGQTRPVQVTMLHIPGTTDQLVSRTLTEKLQRINEILED